MNYFFSLIICLCTIITIAAVSPSLLQVIFSFIKLKITRYILLAWLLASIYYIVFVDLESGKNMLIIYGIVFLGATTVVLAEKSLREEGHLK